MSSPDKQPEIPRLAIWGDQINPVYNLNRGPDGVNIPEETFWIIKNLSDNVPRLVNASRLNSYHSWSAFSVQRFAETMHWLSQPRQLGELLQWETHGNLIVGYRLTQPVKIVDRRPPVIPVPALKGLRRLLSHL